MLPRVKSDKKITIGEFYGYIFGDKIKQKHLQNISSKKGKESQKDLQEINQIRSKAQTEKAVSIFEPILKGNKKNEFRNMLRASKCNTLEIILFGNDDEELPKTEESFLLPTDNEIRQLFHKQNKNFRIFNEKNRDKAESEFITCYKGYKLINDYQECLSIDTAYNAYKLIVIFQIDSSNQNPFRNIEKYLLKHNGYDEYLPIQNLTNVQLPKLTEENEIHDLSGWRTLIQKHGAKAMKYFKHAFLIESSLGKKAPQNIEQTIEILAKSFNRYDQYPELAKLCVLYQVNEDDFNRALELKKKIKKFDILPSIVIDGLDVSEKCSGYYLVKLPINDPRAFILGKITNCCQSIGGQSEACVINGITREDNAFYVMLKRIDMKSSAKPHLVDGSINYQDFIIVGQGNAWLSRHGNLTFDSWENLRARDEDSNLNSEDDAIAYAMLSRFIELIINQPKSEMIQATIGCGNFSKTPLEFKRRSKLDYPEKLASGFQDADSNLQVIIHLNKEKQDQNINLIIKNSELVKLTSGNKEHNAKIISIFTALCHSKRRSEWINTHILEPQNQKIITAINKLMWDANKCIYPYLWEILYCLHENNIFNTSNIDLLKKVFTEKQKLNILFIAALENIILNLSQFGLLKDSYPNLCTKIENFEYERVEKLNKGLRQLNKYSILNTLSYKIVMSHPKRAVEFAHISNYLHERNLLTDTNVNNLISRMSHHDICNSITEDTVTAILELANLDNEYIDQRELLTDTISLQRFFSTYDNKEWQQVAKKLNTSAMLKLDLIINNIKRSNDKSWILEYAKSLDIFKDHPEQLKFGHFNKF